PTLIRQCMRDEPMTIHGDGMNVRDWLHVEDHCEGLLSALRLGQSGSTYNFGGECEMTNRDIATVCHFTTRRVLGLCATTLTHQIVHTEDRPGNDRRYASN